MRGDLNRHGMRGWTRKKKRGNLVVLPARGTRTMRMSSSDARIRGSTRPPPEKESEQARKGESEPDDHRARRNARPQKGLVERTGEDH